MVIVLTREQKNDKKCLEKPIERREDCMPIYEFTCSACGHNFEKLCKVSDNLSAIECPSCGARTPRKKLSLFGCNTGEGSTSGSSCGGCSSKNCGSCGH